MGLYDFEEICDALALVREDLALEVNLFKNAKVAITFTYG